MDDGLLPISNAVDVTCLSRCFRNVVNSYKFFWFLALLDCVLESESSVFYFDEMALRMLSLVWYPLDFFKLSFGTLDGFKPLAEELTRRMEIDNSVNAAPLLDQMRRNLSNASYDELKKKISTGLMRWVSYRFMTPFFDTEVRGKRDHEVNKIISTLSQAEPYKSRIPYSIQNNIIQINPVWREYFISHQAILRGFIRWHLIKFLQTNNPNVIGLSEKLEKPQFRDLKFAKRFWTAMVNSNETYCIYSGQLITSKNLSLDHFIPWTYIAHDQLWNIIPTTKSVNSSKGDMLPNLARYSDGFCNLQFKAYQYHFNHGNFKLLEDYFQLVSGNSGALINYNEFSDILLPEISMHHRSATHLGFRASFIYED